MKDICFANPQLLISLFPPQLGLHTEAPLVPNLPNHLAPTPAPQAGPDPDLGPSADRGTFFLSTVILIFLLSLNLRFVMSLMLFAV